MIETELIGWLGEGLRAAAPELGLGEDELPAPELSIPKQKEHGDFATNVALALAGRAGRPPREVAAALVEALPAVPFVERVEVAGPGFINVFTTDAWLHDTVRAVLAAGDRYGAAEDGGRVQVEFVSANPTGPLTIGHARNAAIGDTVARLLEHRGRTVEREYYFNDAGGQMDRFGASVEARYLQAVGRDAEVPEDGYHGDYIEDYARDILATEGPGLADLPPEERFLRLRAEGARRAMEGIRATLARFGVVFDTFVSEATLASKGEIAQAIERLSEAGTTYEHEGALWFRSTAFGDDKDRVLVRSNGQHTYFAADCAYVLDKAERGFDRMIYVWGADHHGDVVRVKGAAQVLGIDPERVELLIYQFVTFLRGGQPMKMSKRAGTFVTLDQLIDEVGTDAARFHLLLFSNDHTMNFDIVEVQRASMDNPVYYVQYGHARIVSILRRAAAEGLSVDPDADLSPLVHDAELDLIRALAGLPGVIEAAASKRAPHRLAHAAQDVAGRFHRFYTDHRVVSDDASVTAARLALCAATKQVLAIALSLLGVGAPERMDREDA